MPKIQSAKQQRSLLKRCLASVWFFPLVLLVPLLLLTVFKINGSSIGIYHAFFYGNTTDSNLLLNKPRVIRSDEWVVNTQMTIAQSKADYPHVNQNVGTGEDMSILLDTPYKEWSALFKPHNWSFFILPFEYAFAFKWWVMSYLLVISAYFFVLALLPRKRLLAAAISLGLLFSPFIQWWYQYATLAPLYYSLFAASIVVHLMDQKSRLRVAGWGFLLTYVMVCFALVLYPPFQISCGFALAAFVTGYILEKRSGAKGWFKKIGVIALSLIIAAGISFAFLQSRADAIHTIQSTAYPGNRVSPSGNFSIAHTLSGHLSMQFQYDNKAVHYVLPESGLVNQSESSNFILLQPFLLIPTLYLLFRQYRDKRSIDWPLLLITITFLAFFMWLFIPHIPILGKIMLLDRIPHPRMLIGLGLLNLIQLVLFIRIYARDTFRFSKPWVLGYVTAVFVIEIVLAFYAHVLFPEFIGLYKVVALSIPIPLIIYLLLGKKFSAGAIVLLLFSFVSTALINPLYKGTEILTQNALSKEISTISKESNAGWVVEDSYLENFAVMNGARSLTGVYSYPQLNLWRSIDTGAQSSIYNRYAHVSFNFDRHADVTIPTQLQPSSEDHFGVLTEPCSQFLRDSNVHYLVTSARLSADAACAHVIASVPYPSFTAYIYRLY